MTTIARLLLGLSKKGINPKVIEHSGQLSKDNHIMIYWQQAEREISVFFDKLNGKYKGYTRSLTKNTKNGREIETVSLERLADESNFRKSMITKNKESREYVFNPSGEDYTAKHVESTQQIVTTSIDSEAFTVLRQTPSDTQVSIYDSIQIFPLSHK